LCPLYVVWTGNGSAQPDYVLYLVLCSHLVVRHGGIEDACWHARNTIIEPLAPVTTRKVRISYVV
jgi:hypothetical protein